MKRFPVLLARLAVPVALAAAPKVHACAVCFGRTDSPLGKGLHWGVLALLVFIFAMLAAFGAFAVYLVRRASAIELEQRAEEEAARSGRPEVATS